MVCLGLSGKDVLFLGVFFEVLDVDLFGGKRCFLSLGGELFYCIFLGS